MYSRAGIMDGVKVSVSKLKSAERGDEIISEVTLLGELGT